MLKSPLFLLLLFSLTGCGPVSQPVWNHDSRSFFYTQSDGAILQYDVEKRATRNMLVAGEPRPRQVALGTSVPTVSFAHAAFSPRAQAVQVGVKSLLDGQQGWSNLEVWGDAGARRPTRCRKGLLLEAVGIWCRGSKSVTSRRSRPGKEAVTRDLV